MSIASWIRFSHLVDKHGGIPAWRPERVAKLQTRRLRELLKWSVAKSPFYREKYAGVDVGRCDLADLPTTTKDEIRNSLDDVVTDPNCRRSDLEQFVADVGNLGKWYRGKYIVCHTSGSQGAPLLIIQDRRCIEVIFSLFVSRSSAAPRPGLLDGISRLVNPERVAIVRHRPAFYPSSAILECMQEILGRYVQVKYLEYSQPDLVAKLKDFQPHVLIGYASVLESLASQSKELALRCLNQVSNISEQLTASVRARIEIAFDVPVVNHYGMGECLQLADGCSAGNGFHINTDWAILESVDEHNHPVPPGMKGSRVLVTNLANRVQPFIRYEVSDRLSLAPFDCPCGNRLPLIQELEGRGSDFFWVHDGGEPRFLPGVLFHSAIDELGWVREWQAVQVQRNRIELKVQLGISMSPVERSIPSALLASLGKHGLPPNVSCDIQVVPEIRANATTGKLQRMISCVGAQSPHRCRPEYARR